MRTIGTISLLLLFPLFGTGCGDGTPEREKPVTLIDHGYDENEMEAAIEKARREVDSFIKVLNEGRGENFAVKTPISDGDEVEHFWLVDVVYRDGNFEGAIGNDPGIVRNVTIGQQRTIAKNEISDWMYLRDGKMYGNYTMRPLLKTMPEDQAAKFREMLAEP